MVLFKPIKIVEVHVVDGRICAVMMFDCRNLRNLINSVYPYAMTTRTVVCLAHDDMDIHYYDSGCNTAAAVCLTGNEKNLKLAQTFMDACPGLKDWVGETTLPTECNIVRPDSPKAPIFCDLIFPNSVIINKE